MTFKGLNLLINKTLDRNDMKPNELYIFKGDKDDTLAAWLDKGELRIKKTKGK